MKNLERVQYHSQNDIKIMRTVYQELKTKVDRDKTILFKRKMNEYLSYLESQEYAELKFRISQSSVLANTPTRLSYTQNKEIKSIL
jgi:hypothetical protein